MVAGVETGEPLDGVAEFDLLEISGVLENPIGGFIGLPVFLDGGGGGGGGVDADVDADGERSNGFDIDFEGLGTSTS